MSLDIFASAYSGTLADRVHSLLLANTSGAVATSTTPDLWMQFLAQRGYTTGTLNDRQRQWLLSYLSLSDTGQTLAGLWGLVLSPFSEGPTYLLDTYAGALVAYSTARKLRAAYAGPLLRVRRSSDNAEQDIGFVSETGVVDVSALTTFVGANSGFVVTMYNQAVGGGLDATIGTAASQPTIVAAGVVQTLGTNAYPAPLWDGAPAASGDDRLSVTNLTLPSTELLLYWACRDTDHTYYRAICHYGTAGVGSGEFAIYSPDIDHSANEVSFYNGSTSFTTKATSAAPYTYVGRVRGNLLAGSTLRNVRTNKSAEGTGTTTSGTYGAAKNLHIGNRSDGISSYAGVIGEFILYNSLTNGATDGIDNSMMNFWGIT